MQLLSTFISNLVYQDKEREYECEQNSNIRYNIYFIDLNILNPISDLIKFSQAIEHNFEALLISPLVSLAILLLGSNLNNNYKLLVNKGIC